MPLLHTPIVVTEVSGYKLTDYAVKVTLNATWDGWGNVSEDGKDIYFVDRVGQPLYFWVEEWDYVNQRALLWVKVSEVPANGVVKVYLRHGLGNPYLLFRNPHKVFEFFDDFLGTEVDTNKWVYESAKVSVSNSILSIRGAVGCDLVLISTPSFSYTKGSVGVAVRWRSRFVSEYANSGWDLFIPHQDVGKSDCAGTTGSYYLFANYVN
jgi:hypothetical protein